MCKMVYLDNITTVQVVRIPKVMEMDGTLRLSIISTMELTTVFDAMVTDSGASSRYYTIAVTLPSGTAPGEYEYFLKCGAKIINEGVLCINDAGSTPTQYETTVTYDQYNGQ